MCVLNTSRTHYLRRCWCGEPRSDCLPQVLENTLHTHCIIITTSAGAVARDLRRYNARHDAVLQEIVVPCLPPTSSWTADICDNYCFPTHITPTDLRPDLVWWDDSQKTLCLAELTVCYDTNFAEAACRKSKYEDLGPTATTLPHSPSKWVHVGFRTMLASPTWFRYRANS